MAKKAAKTAAKASSKPEPKAKAKAAGKATASSGKAEKAVKAKKSNQDLAGEEVVEETENSAPVEKAAEKPAKAAKVPKEPKAKKSKAKAALDVSAGSEHHNKWLELKEKHSKDKAASYAMSGTFEAHQPLQHKSLGWGLILSNNNDRLEVLFESGVKILISNYKP